MIAKAVFAALDIHWQKVLAEVRIQAECATEGNDALGFIRERLIKPGDKVAELLGDGLMFAALSFETPPEFQAGDSLGHPKREIRIEVLREDPRNLYLELMSQWSQVPTGQREIDLSALRAYPNNSPAQLNVI